MYGNVFFLYQLCPFRLYSLISGEVVCFDIDQYTYTCTYYLFCHLHLRFLNIVVKNISLASSSLSSSFLSACRSPSLIIFFTSSGKENPEWPATQRTNFVSFLRCQHLSIKVDYRSRPMRYWQGDVRQIVIFIYRYIRGNELDFFAVFSIFFNHFFMIMILFLRFYSEINRIVIYFLICVMIHI